MRTMIRTLTIDIVGDKPISTENVAKARYIFGREAGENPDTLVLGGDARYELLKNMEPYNVNFEQFMGMKLVHSYEIDTDEWMVRKANSKTYEVKGAES